MFQDEPPKKVLYCYNTYQDGFNVISNEVENIAMIEGIPSREEINTFSDHNHNIVILDDLGHKLMQNPDIEVMFTQLAHHMNLSVIFVLYKIYDFIQITKRYQNIS